MNPISVKAAAEEMLKMAQAGAIPKWVLPAALGAAGVAGTAGGAAIGHSRGKKTGRKEGLDAGLRAGGRAGYRAGVNRTNQAYARHRQILSSLSELTQSHPEGVMLRRDNDGRIGYYLVDGKNKAASAFPTALFASLLMKEAGAPYTANLAMGLAKKVRGGGRAVVDAGKSLAGASNQKLVKATKGSLRQAPQRGPHNIDPTRASGGHVDVRPVVSI